MELRNSIFLCVCQCFHEKKSDLDPQKDSDFTEKGVIFRSTFNKKVVILNLENTDRVPKQAVLGLPGLETIGDSLMERYLTT